MAHAALMNISAYLPYASPPLVLAPGRCRRPVVENAAYGLEVGGIFTNMAEATFGVDDVIKGVHAGTACHAPATQDV